MRVFDDPEASRSMSTRLEARSSLKRFKGTAEYRQMLKTTIAAKVDTRGTGAERRRAKLDRLQASLELEHLTTGGTPDEFNGLLYLPDPLRGD